MVKIDIVSRVEPRHRLGEEPNTKTLDKVRRAPRTFGLSDIELDAPRGCPLGDQLLNRSVRHSECRSDIVRGSRWQNGDCSGFSYKAFGDLPNRAVTSRDGYDINRFRQGVIQLIIGG